MESPDGTQMVKLNTRPGVRIKGLPLLLTERRGCVVYENRSGYCWVPPPASMPILVPEVDRWLRENVGPRHGETFVIDRVYYPGEELPDLSLAWQAFGVGHARDIERWTIGSSGGLRHDTVFFDTIDSAVLFRMRWNGELIEW